MPSEIVLTADLVYAQRGDLALKLDLYRLRFPAVQPMPAVIFVHGGAWRSGRKDQPNPVLWELAQQGYVGVSIQYRLSQTAPWPAQLEDARSAVRWLRRNADQYGVDPRRIGVFGSSSGAHIAALLALNPGDEEARVHACATLFAPTDLERLANWRRVQPKRREDLLGENSPERQLFAGRLEEDAELVRSASPMTYVSGDAPPFLIVHGTLDETVPMNQAMLLHDAMRTARARADLFLIPGLGHELRWEAFQSRVVDFFVSELGPRPL